MLKVTLKASDKSYTYKINTNNEQRAISAAYQKLKDNKHIPPRIWGIDVNKVEGE